MVSLTSTSLVTNATNLKAVSAVAAQQPVKKAEKAQSEVTYGGPHRWQISWWAKAIRRLWRYRAYTRWVEQACTSLEVRGLEHLDRLPANAIFVPNHQSHMDTLILHAALPERIKSNLYIGAAADRWFVKGKKKVILQPWYQSLILGNFPIHRGGGSKTLNYARWLLSKSCNLCIFAEGTRNAGERLGKFKPGVALLATQKQVPIVPVVLKGLHGMRAKGQREVTPGSAEVVFLEPLFFSRDMDIERATQMLWNRMNEELEQAEEVIDQAA